jgi:hypothetical protein
VEIDVGPAQPEQLALAHAGGDRQDVERLQPVAVHGLQEGSCLVGGENAELVAGPSRWGDQFGDVAWDQAPSDGVP